MTKDEIKSRIAEVQAEIDGLKSGAAAGGQPEGDSRTRMEHLEHEIASLKTMLEEA